MAAFIMPMGYIIERLSEREWIVVLMYAVLFNGKHNGMNMSESVKVISSVNYRL